MESEPMLIPREKSPHPEKFFLEEHRTHDAASSMTASPTHYQRAIPAPVRISETSIYAGMYATLSVRSNTFVRHFQMHVTYRSFCLFVVFFCFCFVFCFLVIEHSVVDTLVTVEHRRQIGNLFGQNKITYVTPRQLYAFFVYGKYLSFTILSRPLYLKGRVNPIILYNHKKSIVTVCFRNQDSGIQNNL